MAESPRVAVYIDFDNVVISRYDHVFGRGAWKDDGARRHAASVQSADPIDVRLAEAVVDIGAIIDYASSFGTVAMTRAYADWSVPANASYQKQLVERAVDLVQLFPASGTKNGADIRLAIDAINDLHQHSDITTVVLVAGDSDYIALAQRCKQIGRFVVGIGVAGSTSRALVAACDVFADYARIPGVTDPVAAKAPPAAKAASDGPKKAVAKKAAKTAVKKATKKSTKKAAAKSAGPVGRDSGADAGGRDAPSGSTTATEQSGATALLVRAIRLGLKNTDDEWVFSSGVKSQMQRMDATFDEKTLGYSSFRAFVESRTDAVDSEVVNGQVRVRLR